MLAAFLIFLATLVLLIWQPRGLGIGWSTAIGAGGALHVARWGGGSGRQLFVLLVLLGAAVAALFANDGAALILTPIVIAMLLELKFSAKATLAFVMAAGFIADTASLPLVVSNLVNIVSADYFNIGFVEYAAVIVPVNAVAVIAAFPRRWTAPAGPLTWSASSRSCCGGWWPPGARVTVPA